VSAEDGRTSGGARQSDAYRGATWLGSAPPPPPRRLTAADWLRILRRGGTLCLVLVAGLVVLLMLRTIERPFYGARRPVTGEIPRVVLLLACWLIGLHRVQRGTPMTGLGAAVANHASWLDIFVLNAADDVLFVAKSEVAGWPGIGWLARATGTIFVRRARGAAAEQTAELAKTIARGDRPLLFPEGTSSDGARVLPFKPALFAAFSGPGRAAQRVQPIALRYSAPEGEDPRLYSWWGDMGFGPHLLQVLALPQQGTVTVAYLPPRTAGPEACRKRLAAACEADIRAEHVRLAARASQA
jgi:lyso-ornithine lipid O-acyltransferase